MVFSVGDRVEIAGSNVKGEIEKDDGVNVRVKWDDGQIGLLEYKRGVAYNAYRLIRLRSNPKS